MIFDYKCEKCDEVFEIIMSASEHTFGEKKPCPQCQNLGAQDYSRCNVHFTGTKVKDAYKCPALGQIIKSDYDRSEVAKRKGAVEIGNDFGTPDKLQTHFDKRQEEKRRKSWESD